MIIAQSKKHFLLSWFILLFGLILLIVVGANLRYDALSQSPIGFIITGLIILVIFFLLPVYNIIVSRELSIEKRVLRIKSFPSQHEKSYDLRNLVWWEVKRSPGRYSFGRNLYLRFVDQSNIQRNVHLSEMEFANFEAVVAYFNAEFQRIKKREKT